MTALNPIWVRGLSLLLVLILALRGSFGYSLDLPSPQKNQYFQILIGSGMIDKGPPCGWATSDPLFILIGCNNIIICARMFGSPFFLQIYMNLKTFSKIPKVIKWGMVKTSSGQFGNWCLGFGWQCQRFSTQFLSRCRKQTKAVWR